MKTAIVLISFAVIIAVVSAQQNKGKGEACTSDNECKNSKCIESYCDCKKGQKPQTESHAQGPNEPSTDVSVCKKVVGEGCNHNEECSVHLENAKCEKFVCVCNKDDGCTDAAQTITVLSLTAIMGAAVAVMKIW